MTAWDSLIKPMDEPAFGLAACAYGQHRLGFPATMYDRWQRAKIIGASPISVVDLGTGTGAIARSLAEKGHSVTGIDMDADMLAEANRIAATETLNIDFLLATADETGLADGHTDLVTAGQCWHWFDRPAVLAEARRILKPDGILMICYYDWLPLPGSLVAATESLILKHSPNWRGAGGVGMHPGCLADLASGGFGALQSFTFDDNARYTPESWVGRIEASAGIAALKSEKRDAFKSELAGLIAADYAGDILELPHRVFCAWGQME